MFDIISQTEQNKRNTKNICLSIYPKRRIMLMLLMIFQCISCWESGEFHFGFFLVQRVLTPMHLIWPKYMLRRFCTVKICIYSYHEFFHLFLHLLSTQQAAWGAFLFASSMCVFTAIGINGQTDILGIPSLFFHANSNTHRAERSISMEWEHLHSQKESC